MKEEVRGAYGESDTEEGGGVLDTVDHLVVLHIVDLDVVVKGGSENSRVGAVETEVRDGLLVI